MRITNNMIMGNTKTNINSAKTLVDKYNTQMTTQKKIDKASDDPVIAIRSRCALKPIVCCFTCVATLCAAIIISICMLTARRDCGKPCATGIAKTKDK